MSALSDAVTAEKTRAEAPTLDAAFRAYVAARLLQPVKVIGGASLSVGIVANAWHDLDTGGSAAARPLDVVIPNVTAGQWIKIEADFVSSATAAFVNMDMATIVAGAVVNRMGSPQVGGAGGISGWELVTSAYSKVQGWVWYQVQAGDIENGSIRCRLQDMNSTTTARTVAGGSGFSITLAGTGPF